MNKNLISVKDLKNAIILFDMDANFRTTFLISVGLSSSESAALEGFIQRKIFSALKRALGKKGINAIPVRCNSIVAKKCCIDLRSHDNNAEIGPSDINWLMANIAVVLAAMLSSSTIFGIADVFMSSSFYFDMKKSNIKLNLEHLGVTLRINNENNIEIVFFSDSQFEERAKQLVKSLIYSFNSNNGFNDLKLIKTEENWKTALTYNLGCCSLAGVKDLLIFQQVTSLLTDILRGLLNKHNLYLISISPKSCRFSPLPIVIPIIQTANPKCVIKIKTFTNNVTCSIGNALNQNKYKRIIGDAFIELKQKYEVFSTLTQNNLWFSVFDNNVDPPDNWKQDLFIFLIRYFQDSALHYYDCDWSHYLTFEVTEGATNDRSKKPIPLAAESLTLDSLLLSTDITDDNGHVTIISSKKVTEQAKLLFDNKFLVRDEELVHIHREDVDLWEVVSQKTTRNERFGMIMSIVASIRRGLAEETVLELSIQETTKEGYMNFAFFERGIHAQETHIGYYPLEGLVGLEIYIPSPVHPYSFQLYIDLEADEESQLLEAIKAQVDDLVEDFEAHYEYVRKLEKNLPQGSFYRFEPYDNSGTQISETLLKDLNSEEFVREVKSFVDEGLVDLKYHYSTIESEYKEGTDVCQFATYVGYKPKDKRD